MLTKDQIDSFNEDGFLVIPNFSTLEEVTLLRNTGLELVSSFDPSSRIKSIFSTRNQTKKTDQYFLDSANDIGYFFEEGAFDQDGNLTKPKELALNKLGHAMHDLVPAFKSWTRTNIYRISHHEIIFYASKHMHSFVITSLPLLNPCRSAKYQTPITRSRLQKTTPSTIHVHI